MDPTNQSARRIKKRICLLIIGPFAVIPASLVITSCQEDGLAPVGNTIFFEEKLSTYGIFQGEPSSLTPSDGFHLYELATELFSDYAEKQRLIKLPDGSRLTSIGSTLPDFPDRSVLVKTFYYYNDKRDQAKGRKIIESRLLVKSGDTWNVAVYLWNKEQTDAVLVTSGLNTTVNWIDDEGNGRVISYHVPSNRECATCHHSAGETIPLGPKLRNLNRDVSRDGQVINQLAHLTATGLLSGLNPHDVGELPAWNDPSIALKDRARAYLDVNCGHCHNSRGVASNTRLFLTFETSIGDSNIRQRKNAILSQMKSGGMPRLGTSLVHDEGLDLVEEYIRSL